ncbi:hypothetical protein B0J14DRAFT_70889 [Halenospora varia]|nr:hypothetical protein B0J14DRAFT_70889 [Halenospora varia]
MPLQSQFSLSLELTKLVPMALVVAGKTYEAAMSLARDLQSSGSDIVIEEDLAELFGRARITSNLAASFRTVVSQFEPLHAICEKIALYNGAGPTVTRGLTEAPYFSMIVQCSFLVYVHERNSLATAISQYFESKNDGAPEGWAARAIPSVEGIRGSLQACEDQTSAFCWDKLLSAVAATLGMDEEFPAIPTPIFHGLISMLPLVQHLPQDRMIVVEMTEESVPLWCGLISSSGLQFG